MGHLIGTCYQLIGYPLDFKFKNKQNAHANFVDAHTSLTQKEEVVTILEEQYQEYVVWKHMRDKPSTSEGIAHMAGTGKYFTDSQN